MKGYDVTANARSRIDIRGRYQHWGLRVSRTRGRWLDIAFPVLASERRCPELAGSWVRPGRAADSDRDDRQR
jgi:hypothetical protein